MLKANQICMIESAYDAVGCAYLIGLQIALEAVEYAESRLRVRLLLPANRSLKL